MPSEHKGEIPEDLEIGDIWRSSLSIPGPEPRLRPVIRKLVQDRARLHAHKCVFCLTPERHLEEAIAGFGIKLWEWNRGNQGHAALQLEERKAG